jgi:hypothetical protein
MTQSCRYDSFISLWLISHQQLSEIINISYLAMTQRSSRLFWWFVLHVIFDIFVSRDVKSDDD